MKWRKMRGQHPPRECERSLKGARDHVRPPMPGNEILHAKLMRAEMAAIIGSPLAVLPSPRHYSKSMQERCVVSDKQGLVREAARLIGSSKSLTAFTGAGVSVESGIPPFRGAGGLWSKYDPRMLELDYFLAHPESCWPVIREIFYDHFGAARPNRAHEVLAAWEARGLLKLLITQNIDSVQWNR